MLVRVKGFLRIPSLAHQFMLASLVVLVAGMLVIGWWVGRQIEAGVMSQTAGTTALYVDSFITPHLQDLAQTNALAPEGVAQLSSLLRETPLGQRVVAFKVWDASGRILYSTSPSNIGQVFPVRGGLARAWQGEVSTHVSDLRDEENASERERWSRLLETYSPVRLAGTNRIIAVAEFYQVVDDLQKDVLAAQLRSWLVVGAATLAMYLLLAGIVRRGSDTIVRQQAELSDKVAKLTDLLRQNAELHERVRRAATRTTALNERFLRRVSAELHDGPAQDLGLALLRMDGVMERCAACPIPGGEERKVSDDLGVVQTSLGRALQEVRAISAGLRLPELGELTLAETLARVVRDHERRTNTTVVLKADKLPEQVPLPVKITVYRLVQEALSNAYRHGGGVGQQVQAEAPDRYLRVHVIDDGPGFDWPRVARREDHMGLTGMKERVESLGGLFQVKTGPGKGTRVTAWLPIDLPVDEYE